MKFFRHIQKFNSITFKWRNVLIFLFIGVLFSCSIEKRHYRKGHYVNWKSNKRSPDNNPSKISNKAKTQVNTSAQTSEEIPNTFEASSSKEISFHKSFNSNFIDHKTSIKKEKDTDLFKRKAEVQDSIVKKVNPSIEKEIKRKSKVSFVLGLISLISTILFILFIITIPIAIFSSVLAIIDGKKALALLDRNPEFNSKYRKKAMCGIKMALVIYYFLLTVLLIGILVFSIYCFLFLVMFFAHIAYIFPISLSATLLIASLSIWAYVVLLEKIGAIKPK